MKVAYIIVLITSISLLACGGGGSSDAANTTSVTPPPTTIATPTPTSLPYVKLDASGNTLADNATSWSCIKSTSSGLVWEVKTDSGLRNWQTLYTNFDDTSKMQDGDGLNVSASSYPTQAQIDASTNSIGYIASVNATSLCGATNWRLPTSSELKGIYDSSSSTNHINTSYFNDVGFTTSSSNPDATYWTSSAYSVYSTTPVLNEAFAWSISFRLSSSTSVVASNRGDKRAVRLVHQ